MFASVCELVVAIDEYVARHDTKCEPLIWTASVTKILENVIRANVRFSPK